MVKLKEMEKIQIADNVFEQNNIFFGDRSILFSIVKKAVEKYFEKIDIFEIEKLSRNFDYIVSNPPYIPFDEYNKLEKEVKDYEPLISLTDKENGLKFYERIFKIASAETFTGKVYCETGFDQKEDLEKILLQYNFSSHCFYKDYSGNFRILEVKK